MDQLVNLVAQHANISPEQAQKAVQTVMGFLKDKLPPPVAAQLDSVVGGQGAGGAANQAQQMLGGLGGMLGQKPGE